MPGKADGMRRTSEATGIAANVWGVSLKPVPKKKIVMVKTIEEASPIRSDVNPIRLKPLTTSRLNQALKHSKVNGVAFNGHHPLTTKASSDTGAKLAEVKS